MSNRFRRVQILTRSLSPVDAILTVVADAEADSPQIELRGRLTGPTCPYASTIEVAYPLHRAPGVEQLIGKIAIPEPSLWDPVSQFLYHGHFELWVNSKCQDRATIRHGLRSLRLEPPGLFWNGKPLKLRTASRFDLTPNDLPALRAESFNAFLVDWPARVLLEAAEQIGFVVLARLSSPADERSIADHSTALLGWVLPEGWRSNESAWRQWLQARPRIAGMRYDGGQVPEGLRFLIGGPEIPMGLPRIMASGEGELGWLESG